MAEPAKSSSAPDTGEASLPVLVARLGEDVLRLIDAKLSLLKLELREDLWVYGRNLIALLLAGVIGASGFALVNVAVAFVVADLLQTTEVDSAAMHYAVGFAATGLVYLITGTAIAVRSWRRLSNRDSAIVKTVAELEPKKITSS